jgi:hypothetical protein
MNNQDFTTTILVDQSATEAFDAIKNVRSWWSGLYDETFEGSADKLDDEFSFRAGGGAHYSKQKLVELIPNKKIVWLVIDSELTFLENEKEWIGSKISFDISTENNKTKIVFTHQGLVPDMECYDSCAPAWSQYVRQQLLNWILKVK